ncbi:hypothetical protein RchiOBHm_Chr5g0007331 [Rosa chinensis]|uniref:Uncharacterized protein n=1 Tax=Rosa chinensis TaxID=74649 RepID=A0A2P6Q3R6_ROSCH|nr:hypothetical protein RchiOBHm_Chr5g0007331 [Rosa chinensis]
MVFPLSWELNREEPAGMAWVDLILDVMFSNLEVLLFPGKGLYLDIASFFLFWLCSQITFSLLFSFVIAFVPDTLSAAPDKASVLSRVMAARNDPNLEGFVITIRPAWDLHLMLIQDALTGRDSISSGSSSDLGYLQLYKVLKTAAFENDEEDMCNAYLQKLITYSPASYSPTCQRQGQLIFFIQYKVNLVCIFYGKKIHSSQLFHKKKKNKTGVLLNFKYLVSPTCVFGLFCSTPSFPKFSFLFQLLSGQRIKELKERAMSVLSPYCLVGSHELSHDSNQTAQASESGPLPFVSLLEFKEPEQLSGNDALWTFVNFAGELLVKKVLQRFWSYFRAKCFVLLGGAPCLIACQFIKRSFKQSLAGAILLELPEDDAYLNLLQKVVENGNPLERNIWKDVVFQTLFVLSC